MRSFLPFIDNFVKKKKKIESIESSEFENVSQFQIVHERAINKI